MLSQPSCRPSCQLRRRRRTRVRAPTPRARRRCGRRRPGSTPRCRHRPAGGGTPAASSISRSVACSTCCSVTPGMSAMTPRYCDVTLVGRDEELLLRPPVADDRAGGEDRQHDATTDGDRAGTSASHPAAAARSAAPPGRPPRLVAIGVTGLVPGRDAARRPRRRPAGAVRRPTTGACRAPRSRRRAHR